MWHTKRKVKISLHKLKVLHHTLHFHKSMQAHPYCGMSRRGIFLKGEVGYPKRNGSINLTRYQQNISNVVDISSFSKGELCTVRKISYCSTEMCEKNMYGHLNKTLPKALRTQALTALTSNFGLVGFVQYAW